MFSKTFGLIFLLIICVLIKSFLARHSRICSKMKSTFSRLSIDPKVSTCKSQSCCQAWINFFFADIKLQHLQNNIFFVKKLRNPGPRSHECTREQHGISWDGNKTALQFNFFQTYNASLWHHLKLTHTPHSYDYGTNICAVCQLDPLDEEFCGHKIKNLYAKTKEK